MKRFIRLHIHSTCASYSSLDTLLYKEVDEFIHKDCEVDGDDFIEICFIEDKTFYNGSLFKEYHNTAEYKNLVNKYIQEGYKEGTPKEMEDFYDRKEARRHRHREEENYIFCFPYEEYHRDRIQGGFSNRIWNNKILVNYTQNNPFGYVGHTVRKANLDEYLEIQFMGINNKNSNEFKLEDIFCRWLTSTDGRHFGDSLECYDFEKQKDMIDAHLNEMYNLAYIWSKSDHKGTLRSTKELMEKYKENLI